MTQTDGHLCKRTIAMPGLPALLAQGRLVELRGGQLLPTGPLPQGDINKPRKVQPAPQSFLLSAPGALTNLLTQAPGRHFKPETEAKNGTASLYPEYQPPPFKSLTQSIWEWTDRHAYIYPSTGHVHAWDSYIQICPLPDSKVRDPGKPESRGTEIRPLFKSFGQPQQALL